MYSYDMSVADSPDGVPDDVASAFVGRDSPVLTAVDVAEELDITQQAAHSKLQRAHERGAVERKTVGSRAVVWWVEEFVCPDSE